MEQKIIYCTVRNEYILGAGTVIGAVGSHDETLLRLDFSESPAWSNLSKRCVFTDSLGRNATPILLTPDLLAEGHTDIYLCPVPYEAKTAEGEALLTIEGYQISGETEQVKIVTEETGFKVLPSRLVLPADQDITADQAQQLQAAIDALGLRIEGIDGKLMIVHVTGMAPDQTADKTAKEINEFAQDGGLPIAIIDKSAAAIYYNPAKSPTLAPFVTVMGQTAPGEREGTMQTIVLTVRMDKSVDVKSYDHNTSKSAHADIRAALKAKLDSATIKSAGTPEIVSTESLRSYFYSKRKATSRSWQYEISPGSNENIISALGGFPDGHTAAEKWFLYIDLPYTEAGGFVIHAQLEGRDNGLLYRQDQFATLDQRWHTTGWIRIQDVQANLDGHNTDPGAHSDIRAKVMRNEQSLKLLENSIDDHVADKGNPHGVTYQQTGADRSGAAADALSQANNYADQQDAETLRLAKEYADQNGGKVKTVNGAGPDAAGNVTVPVPTKLSQLTGDSTHRTVTDDQIAAWDAGGSGGGGADPEAEKWGTVKVSETIGAITDETTFRTYFYEQRKSRSRKYQFEISSGGIHENIVTGVGGRPQGADAADSAFIYVEIPYSEAGGFIIHVTYELRSKAGVWEKMIYGTLDSRWQDTGWYQPAFVTRVVIAPHGAGSKADMTASQIINAARKGVVLADYTDPKTGELRTYPYFKQMPDGRAVFAINGYIENGVPKQTLIYVDYAGNVTTETREPVSETFFVTFNSTEGAPGERVYTCTETAEKINAAFERGAWVWGYEPYYGRVYTYYVGESAGAAFTCREDTPSKIHNYNLHVRDDGTVDFFDDLYHPILDEDLRYAIAEKASIDDTMAASDTTYSSEKIDQLITSKADIDYITPEDYGAVGDGVNDDTKALQDALAASVDDGKYLYLDKQYKLTAPIYSGTGPSNKIEVYIRGTFNGGGWANAAGKENLLVVDAIAVFENCTITGEIKNVSAASAAYSGTNAVFRKCKVSGLKFSRNKVYYFGRFFDVCNLSSRTLIEDNFILGVGCFAKADLDKVEGVSITDSTLRGNYIGGDQTSTNGNCFEWVQWNGSFVCQNFIDFFRTIYYVGVDAGNQGPVSYGNHYQVFRYFMLGGKENEEHGINVASDSDIFNWMKPDSLEFLQKLEPVYFTELHTGIRKPLPPYVVRCVGAWEMSVKNAVFQSKVDTVAFVEQDPTRNEAKIEMTISAEHFSSPVKAEYASVFYLSGTYKGGYCNIPFIRKPAELPMVNSAWVPYYVGEIIEVKGEKYQLVEDENANIYKHRWGVLKPPAIAPYAGPYKLIDTITTSDTTGTEIVKSYPVKYSRIIVNSSCPAAEGSEPLYIAAGDEVSAVGVGVPAYKAIGAIKTGRFDFNNERGVWNATAHYGSSGSYTNSYGPASASVYTTELFEYLNRIRIYTFGANLVPGMEFKVYAAI